eukprot:CAMPEP_0182440644 /NCGR_PEP_ID=MMETSP1167-20130531/87196_1 /TAXON_ID=2988 /ORGANISM="Mallomonas Sp, Strain CCMP3275" /LENGTH=356 /DNA_ID=CAMNT_0024634655 /DNA_START=540 /DNA_END=1610 /DNA_ORIENTATION=+
MAQWVTFDLAEKGFTIRISCEDRKQAIEWFGVPGDNVDIVSLTPQSSEAAFSRAVEGVQAIIFCGNFDPSLSAGPLLDPYKRYLTVCSKLLDIANKIKTDKGREKAITVQKAVQLSRSVPWRDEVEQTWERVEGLQMKAGGGWQTLLDSLGGVTDNPVFDEYRALHSALETAVKRSGLDYAIVRAPPTVLLTRAAAKYPLKLIQRPEDLTDLLEEQTNRPNPCFRIGQLDLAETLVQVLLSEKSRVSFTVCEDVTDKLVKQSQTTVPLSPSGLWSLVVPSMLFEEDNNEWERSQDEVSISRRPARNTYYGILGMTDEDMRNSYIIRPEESYLGQLTEDQQVEQYWNSMLKDLKQDL